MQVDNIPFTLTVSLGTTTLPKAAYLQLQVGDILVLDQKISQELTVHIGQQKRYLATAGFFETHKAVIIDERIHIR